MILYFSVSGNSRYVAQTLGHILADFQNSGGAFTAYKKSINLYSKEVFMYEENKKSKF